MGCRQCPEYRRPMAVDRYRAEVAKQRSRRRCRRANSVSAETIQTLHNEWRLMYDVTMRLLFPR